MYDQQNIYRLKHQSVHSYGVQYQSGLLYEGNALDRLDMEHALDEEHQFVCVDHAFVEHQENGAGDDADVSFEESVDEEHQFVCVDHAFVEHQGNSAPAFVE